MTTTSPALDFYLQTGKMTNPGACCTLLEAIPADSAALNNMEMLPWDCWGAMPQPNETLSEEQLAFFDHLAMLTHDPDANFAERRELYESGDQIRVPRTVFNAVLQRVDEI